MIGIIGLGALGLAVGISEKTKTRTLLGKDKVFYVPVAIYDRKEQRERTAVWRVTAPSIRWMIRTLERAPAKYTGPHKGIPRLRQLVFSSNACLYGTDEISDAYLEEWAQGTDWKNILVTEEGIADLMDMNKEIARDIHNHEVVLETGNSNLVLQLGTTPEESLFYYLQIEDTYTTNTVDEMTLRTLPQLLKLLEAAQESS